LSTESPAEHAAAPASEPIPLRVDSEVGRLRCVLLHRPGDELKRLTPRNNDELLFDGIPWLDRAQQEHDAFAGTLREHGVEVLLVRNLLVETLASDEARAELIDAAVAPRLVGPRLASVLADHLGGLGPEALAELLIAGMSYEELHLLPVQDTIRRTIVARLAGPHEFVVAPLPNLLFTRDSSLVVGDRPAATNPSLPARRREASILRAIHRHHPRLGRAELLYDAHGDAPLEGGDVLALAAGVIAIGVGERTTPAGAEAFAQRVLAAGVAHTVLAVPVEQRRATMHLDTVCTMVDADAMIMYPPVADTLMAVTVGAGGVRGPEPFLVAAARAMGLPRVRVVETGLDPVTAEREQWDDGNNTLALAPRLVVGYERNVETNARLEDEGIEVLRLAGSELGSGRGGPRCMSSPLVRDPLYITAFPRPAP
jgi:arginine deiminase